MSPIVGFVDDLAQLLDRARTWTAVLAEFGKRTRQRGPDRPLLRDLSRRLRPQAARERAASTSRPSPSCRTSSAPSTTCSRRASACADGLADTGTVTYERHRRGRQGTRQETVPRVLILDPACGTGTFLYAGRRPRSATQFMQAGQRGYVVGLRARAPPAAALRLRAADGPLRRGAPQARHATGGPGPAGGAAQGLGLRLRRRRPAGRLPDEHSGGGRSKQAEPAARRAGSSPTRPTPPPRSNATCRSWWSWAIRLTPATRPTRATWIDGVSLASMDYRRDYYRVDGKPLGSATEVAPGRLRQVHPLGPVADRADRVPASWPSSPTTATSTTPLSEGCASS